MGQDKVRLLRALSIEINIVWEERSLCFAYPTIRSKLGYLYSAETLISIVRDHFPLYSTQTDNEAKGDMGKFRNFFGKTQFCRPIHFIIQME